MANNEHLAILSQGANVWNKWRGENPEIEPDLTRARLTGADLHRRDLSVCDFAYSDLKEAHLDYSDLSASIFFETDLRGASFEDSYLGAADLSGANLAKAILPGANLSSTRLQYANLTGAILIQGYLQGADFTRAVLTDANLDWADLTDADFTEANLVGASLEHSRLVNINFKGANLKGCRVYGISAWGLETDGAVQADLVITPRKEPSITIDSLEVAQFVYLLLNNGKLRDVINSITTKVVLILGRFTPKRKAVLDAIRDELRKHNYLPIIFDFQKPVSRSYRETVSTLAHLARFVIADITSAKVILQELEVITLSLSSVPIQPILQNRAKQNVVIGPDYSPYPWFLPTLHYRDRAALIAVLAEKVVAPAEKFLELNNGRKPFAHASKSSQDRR